MFGTGSVFYRWGKKKVSSAAPTPELVSAVPVLPISVTSVNESAPKFGREYCSVLTTEHSGSVDIKVKLYTSYNRRFDRSEITQANGKWILFDVESPADKIIDRDLLPLVQDFCDRVLALDAEFIKSNPTSVVDENGTVWNRAEKI